MLGRCLEDLDFAYDLVLLSQGIGHMRTKVSRLEDNAGQVGLRVNAAKTKEMRVRAAGKTKPVICREQDLELVTDFTYLGSVINREGGSTQDVSARISRAQTAFIMLRPIWISFFDYQAPNFQL